MAKNPRLIDLAGHRFGLWRVLHQAGNSQRGAAIWRCSCECGTIRDVVGGDLRWGKSTNCGCVGAKRIGHLRKTHGESGTRLYRVWTNMRRRCADPNTTGFALYGGRGIKVCAEWANDFSAFSRWALSSGYADHLSIERLDNDGGYCPENCTWADAATQSANRRFVAKAPDGRLWWHIAQSNGISGSAYRTRINDGWPHEEAATWPMGRKRRDSNLSRAVYLYVDGERMPLAHAAKKIGYSPSAIYQRSKRRGIPLQEALDQLISQK